MQIAIKSVVGWRLLDELFVNYLADNCVFLEFYTSEINTTNDALTSDQ